MGRVHEQATAAKTPDQRIGQRLGPSAGVVSGPASGLLALQRSVGNRVVTALLQPDGGNRALVPFGGPATALIDPLPGLPPGLAPILRIFVDGITDAVRRGSLQITATQGRSLLGLLVDLNAALGGGTGTVIPDGDPSPIPASVSLSGLLGFLLRTDMTEIVGQNDVLVPATWLTEHPIDVTGFGMDAGPAQPGSAPPGLAALSAPTLDVPALVAMFRQPAWQFVVRHLAHLRVALQVLAATAANFAWADDLTAYFVAALAGDLTPADFPAALALTVGQGRGRDWIPKSCLRNLQYRVADATTVVGTLSPIADLTDGELYKALQVFQSGSANLAAWAGGLRDPATQQRRRRRDAPITSPAATSVAPLAGPGPRINHPLENLIGTVPFNQVRAAIVGRGWAYSSVSLVPLAQNMLAERNDPAEVGAHLADICDGVPTLTEVNRAGRAVVALLHNRLFSPSIKHFITNHVALATAADGMEAVLADLTSSARGYTWNPATWTDAATLIGLLQGVPHHCAPADIVGLLANFPATSGLTMARLTQRLTTNFDPTGRNQNVAQVIGDFSTLENVLRPRINQGTISDAAAGWVRQAYRFMTCAPASVNTYLGTTAVKNSLKEPPKKNAAHHLLLFARNHTALGATPAFVTPVTVLAGGANRTVNITEWIVDHIFERHTFQRFVLNDANIDRPGAEAGSTFFERPDELGTQAQIVQLLTNLLGNAAVLAAFPWIGDNPIQIGSYQLRLSPAPGGGGVYRIGQFYLALAAGITIPRPILRALRDLHDAGGFP